MAKRLSLVVCALAVAVGILIFGCAQAPMPTTNWKPFELGHYHRSVSTTHAQAQRAFDQGLIWAYAFNHDEAIHAFQEALRLDPQLAAAWWGIALVNGPHINNPAVDEVHAQAAWEALQKALALRPHASAIERALIDALAKRYALPQPADRKPLDEAYANAMAQVYQRFPDDADVATLYAEALMDTRPWDQWTPEGQPQPGTAEVLAALEHARSLAPEHPGALHLTIHALESSPHPELADEAATRLRTLVPDASHLVHMPGHIDVRLGRWQQAAVANELAMAADQRYVLRQPRIGFYMFYMAHNAHFLSYTAMMEGRSQIAIARAHDIVDKMSFEEVRKSPQYLESFLGVELEALKRFGRWDEIIAYRMAPADLPVASGFQHFVRGVALAATNQLEAAERERDAFLGAIEKIPEDSYWGNNSSAAVLAVAVPFLAGELAYRRGDLATAISKLSEAVQLEDRLRYDEPPAWTSPSRHALGAVLLEAGRASEAEAVYREDLRRYPENGWALSGLAQALRQQGKSAEAATMEQREKAAWARADMPIGASCLCVKKVKLPA